MYFYRTIEKTFKLKGQFMKIDTFKQKTIRSWLFIACIATGIFTSSAQALDIDHVTNKVRQTLAMRGSDHKYQALCAAYNTQVSKISRFLSDFLDQGNRTAARTFIGRLENDLREFQTLIINPVHNDEYLRNQIYNDLSALHNQFQEMYRMIMSNINANIKSGWVLGPKLLPYKGLIPAELRERYNDPVKIANAITFRLKCS